MVHPYDDDRIIAGQATAAKELLEEIADLDALLAPVSGGGLLSGTALAAKHIRPGIRVTGCEPEKADDAYRSMTTGLVWERMKILIEPSSAVPVAPLLRRGGLAALGLPAKKPGDVPRIGIILSGGNIDLAALPFSR